MNRTLNLAKNTDLCLMAGMNITLKLGKEQVEIYVMVNDADGKVLKNSEPNQFKIATDPVLKQNIATAKTFLSKLTENMLEHYVKGGGVHIHPNLELNVPECLTVEVSKYFAFPGGLDVPLIFKDSCQMPVVLSANGLANWFDDDSEDD